jgi:hypothetical protein
VVSSRRRFLGAVGTLLGAVLLDGCGREKAARSPERASEVLEGLLRHERAAGVMALGCTGAGEIARQDRMHAARLEKALGRAPGRASAATAELPAVLARKQAALFAYVNALPRLADPDLRVLVMQIAASEAEHLAALRLVSGGEPAPDAFAGETSPS